MASPLGHAAVGVATAAVVARALNSPVPPVFWLGAVVASGAPDLDFACAWFGKSGPKYHRNASHSFVVIAALVGAGWLLGRLVAPRMSPGMFWAWSASLLTHPMLDVATTGPQLAKYGYGIALVWPLTRQRYFVKRPIVRSPDLLAVRNVRDLVVLLAPEARTIVLPALIVLFAVVLL